MLWPCDREGGWYELRSVSILASRAGTITLRPAWDEDGVAHRRFDAAGDGAYRIVTGDCTAYASPFPIAPRGRG